MYLKTRNEEAVAVDKLTPNICYRPDKMWHDAAIFLHYLVSNSFSFLNFS
jgi:hypothetical protein